MAKFVFSKIKRICKAAVLGLLEDGQASNLLNIIIHAQGQFLNNGKGDFSCSLDVYL